MLDSFCPFFPSLKQFEYLLMEKVSNINMGKVSPFQ
jgi:hypothetical protein